MPSVNFSTLLTRRDADFLWQQLALSGFDQGSDDRCADDFQRVHHGAAGCHQGVGPRHERSGDFIHEHGEVMALGVAEVDDDQAFIGCGNVIGIKGIRGVDHWHALEIDVRDGELRHDEMDVIIQTP